MVKIARNKTVLITGAAGALGSALSYRCAEAGFNTVMLDNRQRELETAWDSIVKQGLPEPCIHPLDLATAGPDQFEQLVSALGMEFQGLDGVVHCAARFDGLRPSDQIPPSEWLQQIQVNLNSAWLLSIACLPLLRQSSSSFLYFLLEDMEKMKKAYWGAYGISKQALQTLVSQLASECAAGPVQVLGINPGPMASPLRAEAHHVEDPGTMPSAGEAACKLFKLISGETRVSEVLIDLGRL